MSRWNATGAMPIYFCFSNSERRSQLRHKGGPEGECWNAHRLLHSCTFVSSVAGLLCALDHSSGALALAQVASRNRLPFDSLFVSSVPALTSQFSASFSLQELRKLLANFCGFLTMAQVKHVFRCWLRETTEVVSFAPCLCTLHISNPLCQVANRELRIGQ